MTFFSRNWKDYTFVAIDTETTGQYPLGAEICEIAAVKYQNGQVIDQFQSLLSISGPMDDFVISIHGITNEMVVGAPTIDSKLPEFMRFIDGCILLAHHAPFDLGFIGWEMEKRGLKFPELPAICTSILSRRMIPESPNHKLQTLIELLQLKKGVAHRALDDALACMALGVKCFERFEANSQLEDIFEAQKGPIWWDRFSITALKARTQLIGIVEALVQKTEVDITYNGGSKPGRTRRLTPLGIVRNLDGDFLVALEPGQTQSKRYFLERILSSKIVVFRPNTNVPS